METLTYLAQINLYWLLLYACYWLLLRRQTFFVWNRAYLLGALVLSFGLPLLQYPAAAPPVPAAVYELTSLPLESATMAVADAAPAAFVVRPQAAMAAAPFPWLDLLLALYAAGAMFMLARLLWQFGRLYAFFQKGEGIPLEGHWLVLLNDDQTVEASPGAAAPDVSTLGSFSFLKWIVINRHDYENDFDTVLRHELVHVQQWHSLDILLVEILRVVFWFNPILILYKKSLQQVHEYLADAAAPQRDRYANFLLAYALNNPTNALTNNFLNSSNLKNRIKMLYKNRNSKWALGKYLAIAPLIALVLALTAARERVVNVVDRNVQMLAPANGWMTELPSVLQAETTTVKGTVRSSKTKNLLPGANVILVGTTRGTTTDADGAFELTEVPLDSKLAISYVGYDTRVVEITKKNQVVNVVLAWQQNPLNELVVVTYGTINEYRPGVAPDSTKKHTEKEYKIVEQMPEFQGGINEMYKYLAKNIRYPAEASRDNVEGKVVVTFTVSDKGFIRNPHITQRLGSGTDEEVLRVVLGMPTWKPGEQNGLPVPMEYVLPIDFQVEKPKPKEDKEKRQGNATEEQSHTTGQGAKAFSFHMPDFKFDDAVDHGLPGHGPNASTIYGAPVVATPMSPYSSTLRYRLVLPESVKVPVDSTEKARFYNYRNPYFNTKN